MITQKIKKEYVIKPKPSGANPFKINPNPKRKVQTDKSLILDILSAKFPNKSPEKAII
jgi:hypothetical protein